MMFPAFTASFGRLSSTDYLVVLIASMFKCSNDQCSNGRPRTTELQIQTKNFEIDIKTMLSQYAQHFNDFLKSNSHFPKKIVLFASMKVL